MSYSTSAQTWGKQALENNKPTHFNKQLSYKELQAALKQMKAEGVNIGVKLNARHDVLAKAYKELKSEQEISIQSIDEDNARYAKALAQAEDPKAGEWMAAQEDLQTYISEQAEAVAPETVVYDLDSNSELHYSLPAHEALRNAYESIVKKNNNTWEYKPVSEYNYKIVNNRTLIIENSSICCAYTPETEVSEYPEDERGMWEYIDYLETHVDTESTEVSEPTPTPANNVVPLSQHKHTRAVAPRRVQRRAKRFHQMLAAA